MTTAEPRHRDARILLVDDHQANLDLLEAFLGDAGYGTIHSTRDPRAVPTLVDRWQARPDRVRPAHAAHGRLRRDWRRSGHWHRPVPGCRSSCSPRMRRPPPAARHRALAAGAHDFLAKPLEEIETLLRIGNLLETRALHTALRERNEALAGERETSERLLLNILPQTIAERLKRAPGVIADSFEEVTVLFADIVDFTAICERVGAEELVEWLNDVFSTMDGLAERFGLEKIKTIGDAYLVAGGLPAPRADAAEAVADMALALRPALAAERTPTGELLRGTHAFEERGEVEIKGKGAMRTHWLTGRRGSRLTTLGGWEESRAPRTIGDALECD